MAFENDGVGGGIGRFQIPQPCGRVLTASDHPAVVRTDDHRVDRTLMANQTLPADAGESVVQSLVRGWQDYLSGKRRRVVSTAAEASSSEWTGNVLLTCRASATSA